MAKAVKIVGLNHGEINSSAALIVDGAVVCKTKKTFTSAEAQAATKFLYEDRLRVDWIAAMLEATKMI